MIPNILFLIEFKLFDPKTGEEIDTDLLEGDADREQEGLLQEGTDKEIAARLFGQFVHINKLIDGGYDAVWTVSQTDSKAHPIKQLLVDGDKLEYYDKSAGAGIIARQQLKPVYHRNGVAYAISRDCIIGQGNIKGENTSFVIIDDLLANIDTELDFTWAEFLLQSKITHL